MIRTSPALRRTTLASLVVALLLALVPVTATATTTDGDATGTVSGTVNTRVATDAIGTAPDGRVVFIDNDSGEIVDEALADADGDYSIELPVGTYAVVFYNSSNGEDFEEFFPELYEDKPLFDLNPTLVEVTADTTVEVDGLLAPLFDDMFDTTFTDDIFFLRNFGVTKGCNPPENTLYCPDRDVSRGEMAAFLVRFFGYTEIDGDAGFRDIQGSTFRNDILKLATAEVTKGCNPKDGNTRYCPTDSVTRGEMAAFIVRAANLTEIDEDVDFRDIDGSTFHDDIRKLATAGITKGCNPNEGNTRFCPERNVSRGEMAAFLQRTADFLIDEFLAEGAAGDDAAAFDRAVANAFAERRGELRDR